MATFILSMFLSMAFPSVFTNYVFAFFNIIFALVLILLRPRRVALLGILPALRDRYDVNSKLSWTECSKKVAPFAFVLFLLAIIWLIVESVFLQGKWIMWQFAILGVVIVFWLFYIYIYVGFGSRIKAVKIDAKNSKEELFYYSLFIFLIVVSVPLFPPFDGLFYYYGLLFIFSLAIIAIFSLLFFIKRSRIYQNTIILLVTWLLLLGVMIFVRPVTTTTMTNFIGDIPNVLKSKYLVVYGQPYNIQRLYTGIKVDHYNHFYVDGVEFSDRRSFDWNEYYKITYLPNTKVIVKIESVQ
jgi:hypothetical protein